MVFGTVGHRSQRHVDIDIVASGTCQLVFTSRHAVTGIDVLGVTKVQQGPQLGIAAQNDVSATTAIATIGTAFWDVFLPAEMQRARAAFARAAEYLYVIYKVRSHFF